MIRDVRWHCRDGAGFTVFANKSNSGSTSDNGIIQGNGCYGSSIEDFLQYLYSTMGVQVVVNLSANEKKKTKSRADLGIPGKLYFF